MVVLHIALRIARTVPYAESAARDTSRDRILSLSGALQRESSIDIPSLRLTWYGSRSIALFASDYYRPEPPSRRPVRSLS